MLSIQEWFVRPIKWGICPCDIVCFLGVISGLSLVIYKILIVNK